ncbi:circadian clock-controlled protein daywake-like [Aricia agestis]|uniref:circadian clock-controlled protein daywake-like n=1 Tax=Aricia agestis TaxID=91739 RepID=UPI001C204B78|nr:circadian clock-controlled protein daywake-like [Aricia agestis]
MYRVLLCLGFLSPILSFSIPKQCKREDSACLEELANAAAKYINSGVPELGIEPLDPLIIEKQVGTVASLDYKFINRTIGGLSNCHIGKIKLNTDLSNLQYQLDCNKLVQRGKYELDGQLLIIPVHGKGDFTMMGGKYLFEYNLDLKKTKGSDGKTYLTIKNFKIKYDPREPLIFEFENLFNGQKELSSAIHNFAHDNWKDLADVLQEPVMNPAWERIFKNVNKFLKTLPVEDVLID